MNINKAITIATNGTVVERRYRDKKVLQKSFWIDKKMGLEQQAEDMPLERGTGSCLVMR